MDSRSTFLHMHGPGRGFGEGQCAGSMAIPGTAGYRRAEECLHSDHMRPCFPEKTRITLMHPVPKPTQVGGYKYTKARGRNLVKELGNMAP